MLSAHACPMQGMDSRDEFLAAAMSRPSNTHTRAGRHGPSAHSSRALAAHPASMWRITSICMTGVLASQLRCRRCQK